MKKDSFAIWVKIIMLTWVFFVIINYFWYLLNADNENKSTPASNENLQNFVNKDVEIVWAAWVAISTNIWTRLKQTKDIPVTVTNDVVDVWYIIANQTEAKDKIIATNMVAISEYLNILKTDVKALLSSSNDRSFALNSYISQLEYRYKAWIENSKNLMSQKTELVKSYNESEKELNVLRTQIWKDFSSFNSKNTKSNIDQYLKLKQNSTNAKTYIVFINKFISYYATLNNYNKKLLDTLINNKEILVKNTQVVLPDSWTDLLKDLNLIYTESEWKK